MKRSVKEHDYTITTELLCELAILTLDPNNRLFTIESRKKYQSLYYAGGKCESMQRLLDLLPEVSPPQIYIQIKYLLGSYLQDLLKEDTSASYQSFTNFLQTGKHRIPIPLNHIMPYVQHYKDKINDVLQCHNLMKKVEKKLPKLQSHRQNQCLQCIRILLPTP